MMSVVSFCLTFLINKYVGYLRGKAVAISDYAIIVNIEDNVAVVKK